jgi:large subunit ribosomal protein L18
VVKAPERLARERRQQRVRTRVRGTDERPRLCVFRSQHHTYAQVISDSAGRTLASASTLARELRDGLRRYADLEAAKQVGLLLARRCKERGITRVVFDRNGFLYHGRVQAVAEGAREGGLEF